MIKTTKIAISIPTEDLKQIESIRKKSGLQRSALIDEAIRFWLDNRKEKEMVDRYEQGYQEIVEDIDEIKVLEGLSAEAFGEEGLS